MSKGEKGTIVLDCVELGSFNRIGGKTKHAQELAEVHGGAVKRNGFIFDLEGRGKIPQQGVGVKKTEGNILNAEVVTMPKRRTRGKKGEVF